MLNRIVIANLHATSHIQNRYVQFKKKHSAMKFNILFSLLLLVTTFATGQTDENIEIKEIDENGVFGKLFYPSKKTNLPTVIVISGSDGGIEFPEKFGKPLAKNGFAVLALPYWKYKTLPNKLSEIPLEYFYKAIDLLKKEEVVDKNRIGIIGYSRGGEGALLIASKSKDIKTVVGLSPGANVAPNIDFRNWFVLKSAWTENNVELPFLPKERSVKKDSWDKVFEQLKLRINQDTLRADFLEIKENPEFEKSAIAVEKINGPILLISGSKDLLWAAETMCDYIIQRLHNKEFPNMNIHINFPLAGHDFITLGFENENLEEDLIKKYVENEYKPGGTIKDNLKAGQESWKFLLEFLNLTLKNRTE